jgi:hypothetical protein
MSSVKGATLIVALASGLSAAFTMALPLGPLAPNDEQPESTAAARVKARAARAGKSVACHSNIGLLTSTFITSHVLRVA